MKIGTSVVRQAATWFKLRFPRAAHVMRNIQPHVAREKLRWKGKSNQEIFSAIYEENAWLSHESRSGWGSTLAGTAQLRAELPAILYKIGVRSLLDAPCGDFNWMQHLEYPFERYVGADIVPNLIDSLQSRYGSPTRSFVVLDITADSLPTADALLCRDCLQHLSTANVLAVINNFKRSGNAFLITSTYPDVKYNPDVVTGGVRPLNLRLPPFGLPEPLYLIDDAGENVLARKLGVWSREQLLEGGAGALTAGA